MKSTVSGICSLLMVMFISMTSLQANNHVFEADTIPVSQKNLYFTIKYGQGGFSDDRSPIGKLGGGQLAICAQHINYPIAISLSGEYYTNSAEPTNPYEISDMLVFNFFYSKYLLKKSRLNVFVGPGLGTMKVPQKYNESANSLLFDIEAGINARFLWKFGLYVTYKYLYANKPDMINFSEHILLIGITFNFKL